MHRIFIVAVLCLCFCSSMAFAENALIKTPRAAIMSTVLDDTGTASGDTSGIDPIGAIVNAVNKLDAWIQKNIW